MKDKKRYRELMEIGLAVKREDDDLVNFKEGIGHSNNSSNWNPQEFYLTPMQMAILDTLYDAGEGATFTPQRMLNSKTRLAYYAQNHLDIFRLPRRGNVSCGHDEYNGTKWDLYKITKQIDEYNFEKEFVLSTRDHDTAVAWQDSQWEIDEDKYGITTRRYSHKDTVSKHDYKYTGECAWVDDKDTHCCHHDGMLYETVLGRYRLIKGEKIFAYFDEQDRDKIDYGNDEGILKSIKHTIRTMMTEARDWLESTYHDYDKETEEYVMKGKRGHYRLTWWHDIARRIKKKGESKRNEEMDGNESNGWKFVTRQNYYNGTRRTDGEWVPIEPIMQYQIVYHRNSYSSTAVDIVYRTEEEALAVVEVINNSKRVSREMKGGQSVGYCTVKEEELEVSMGPDSDITLYTPVQFVNMSYDNTLPEDSPMYQYICRQVEA